MRPVSTSIMRGESAMMPSVAEKESSRETSPAQNGFVSARNRMATASEFSASAVRPIKTPQSKMICMMPLRTTVADMPETTIKARINAMEIPAAYRRRTPSRQSPPSANCVTIDICMPEITRMCEAPATRYALLSASGTLSRKPSSMAESTAASSVGSARRRLFCTCARMAAL